VQGLSLAPLVTRSGLVLEPEHTAREEARARASLARTALAHVDQLADLETTSDVVLDRIRRNLIARLQQGEELGGQDSDNGSAPTAYYQLRREVITVQTTELRRLYDEHQISDATRRQLQHDLDLEETGLPDIR
jgi:CPA1 family monovalent cation:H+ antiporter